MIKRSYFLEPVSKLENDRPDPDASSAAATRERCGDLKIFLGGTPIGHYVFVACVVVLCVLVSAVLENLLPMPLPNLSLVFLTGVLIVASRTSLSPALAMAGTSFLAYNFFFTEPRFSFDMHDTGEIVSVFFFLAMAIIGGNLANRLRAQVAALRATNDQSQMLLSLNNKLAGAPDPVAVRRAAVQAITVFEQTPVCLLTAESADDRLEITDSAPESVALDHEERAAAEWSFKHKRPSGYQSDTLTSVGWRFLPLDLDGTRYGVLGVEFSTLQTRPSSEQLLLLDALANQVIFALARTRLTSSLQQARVAEETERLRASLLSSVSHDLRTPLSSMIGAASSLKELDTQLSPEDKQELLDALLTEGQRLNRYIENLLDMTRLGHGTLKLQRDWVALADLVAAALRRTRALLTDVTVMRDFADNLPLLYVHPALIEQALINVLENAGRFSPKGGEVRISARPEHEGLLITVTDQGPGIPKAQRQKVFDMLFTGGGSDQGPHGSGLGLAICYGMVGAHGGSIEALAGPQGKGTTIAIHLPVRELPSHAEDTSHNEHDKR